MENSTSYHDSLEKCDYDGLSKEDCDSSTSTESMLHYKEKCLSYVNNKNILSPVPSNFEVEWDSDGHPAGERWPPLGAPNDEEIESIYSFPEFGSRSCPSGADTDRLKELEDEQEQMNSSLLALTSHFAQVQFRLKQIVDASPEEKEKLLVELEEFANRGIPDVRQPYVNDEKTSESKLELGHEKQRELIEQLKRQLEDLESFAYQTGEAELPQSIVLKKQKIILDELKGKLNLNVENLDKLSFEELRSHVNQAARELINPLRMKDQLVTQLQTQVVDLERFIEFLQGGETANLSEAAISSQCRCEGHVQPSRCKPRRSQKGFNNKERMKNQLKTDTEDLISKASTLIRMLTLVQFGCGPNQFEKNTLKKTETGYHWGDLRATLEVAIATLVELAEVSPYQTDVSDCELEEPITNSEVMSCVRKQLCPALRDLLQHGLMKINQNTSLVPFLGCLPIRASSSPRMLHAWDLLLAYYKSKHGEQYNKTPARRLSQSFNLDLTGGSTHKQGLLQTIGNIITTHTPLKRSEDAHFKAFVSAALNEKKLVVWLRLIMRTPSIMNSYYQPWSYAAKTGFEDSFRSLEQLSKITFHLPIDLAVKNLQSIKDVF